MFAYLKKKPMSANHSLFLNMNNQIDHQMHEKSTALRRITKKNRKAYHGGKKGNRQFNKQKGNKQQKTRINRVLGGKFMSI